MSSKENLLEYIRLIMSEEVFAIMESLLPSFMKSIEYYSSFPKTTFIVLRLFFISGFVVSIVSCSI